MGALEECHRQLARLLGPDAEPVEVLRCADEHQAYWRPERVRVILLAESHVYTKPPELNHQVNLLDSKVSCKFIRHIYCLGYGEPKLLNRPIQDPKNSGSWQFWKVLYSCVNRVHAKEDFGPMQYCTRFPERIRNKLALLRRLQKKGVWLVDASLAALYFPGRPKPKPPIVQECIQTSWDMYVGQVIRTAKPSHIVCVGKGVAQSLKDRLSGLGVPRTEVPQPNARLSLTKHFKVFQQYYDIVLQAQEQAPTQVERLAGSPRLPSSSETFPVERHRGRDDARVEEPSILIRINRLYRNDMSDNDLYEATRSRWRVAERRERAELAFSVYKGIVREVYRIDRWLPASEGSTDDHTDIQRNASGLRWKFVGSKAEASIRSKYLRKSVAHYFKQGSQNPIKYVNC